MDRDSEVIANFESVLRNQRTKQLLGLYRDKSANSAHSMLNKSYSPSEILSNISKQICAIQNADTANNDRKVSSAAISKCKKTTFMPVNMLPGSNEVSSRNYTGCNCCTHYSVNTRVIKSLCYLMSKITSITFGNEN